MEFIILIITALGGVMVGWRLRERFAERVLNKYLEELAEAESLESEELDNHQAMRLERHGEMVYAYDEKDNFIAQGSNVRELDSAIKARFPDQKFKVKEDNLKEVGLSL
jgi:hypothetical protein